MELKQVGAGTALVLVSSAILAATGTVTSPLALGALSLSPVGIGVVAYLFGSGGVGRPA